MFLEVYFIIWFTQKHGLSAWPDFSLMNILSLPSHLAVVRFSEIKTFGLLKNVEVKENNQTFFCEDH